MKMKIDKRIPRCNKLLVPTFLALKNLGGSGNNEEILSQIIAILNLPDDVVDIPHKDSSMSELAYQAAWARTYLRKCEIIVNSTRSVRAIAPDFAHMDTIDEREVINQVRKPSAFVDKAKIVDKKVVSIADDPIENIGLDLPDEIKPWRARLDDILHNMDLIDGEELISKIAEFGIGVREVKSYEVDEEFFSKI